MDRWGRITGTPLILPPAKAKQGAVAGYPRRIPQTARALAFPPAASGAQAPDAALEMAGGDAAGVTAPTSPETSMRKVLHSGHWAMAAVGESAEAPSAPPHDQAINHEVQIIFYHLLLEHVRVQTCSFVTRFQLTRRSRAIDAVNNHRRASSTRPDRILHCVHINPCCDMSIGAMLVLSAVPCASQCS